MGLFRARLETTDKKEVVYRHKHLIVSGSEVENDKLILPFRNFMESLKVCIISYLHLKKNKLRFHLLSKNFKAIKFPSG